MTSQRWTALVAISTFMLMWWDAAPIRADNGTTPPANSPSQADVSAAVKRFKNGQRLIAKGDYAAAIGEIEQAYQLDPQNVHLYNLAVAHQNNGDRDKAIDYYRRYLAAEPASKLAPDAERYLYQLEAETSAERTDQARAEVAAARAEVAAARDESAAARDEAKAARDEAKAARDEAKAARERAEKAELALRNLPQSCPAVATYPRRAPLPPPTLPPPTLPPPTIDQGIAEDANSGRSWAMPTALTAPAGTVTLSDYELLGLSASYSFTDRLTMELILVLPSTAYSWNTKLQLARSARVQVAAQGILTRFEDYRNDQAGMTTLAGAGGAITLCIDLICRSHLSGFLGAGVGVSQGGHATAQLVGASSLVLGIGQKLKFLFELDTGSGIRDGVLGWYGLRLTSKTIGLDLGIVTPLDASSRSLMSSAPFIDLTFRGYGR